MKSKIKGRELTLLATFPVNGKYKKLHQEEIDKQILRDISKFQKLHYKYFWYIVFGSSLISFFIGLLFEQI